MAKCKGMVIVLLTVLFCAVFVLGTVYASYGIHHSNFINSKDINGSGGWGQTTVISPGASYRPQVNCELQTMAGQSISAVADWGKLWR